ncbi:MAG: deoxyribonuclease IV [Candidatus Hodarchaeota archaeon]
MELKIGFHVSIAGSIDKAVDRAIKLGCTTFQIFTRSPRSWKFKELDPKSRQSFIIKRQTSKIAPVFAHMPYLPNLSSPESEIYQKSVQALVEELKRCTCLKIPFLITHCGSHKGQGIDKGLQQICNALETAYEQCQTTTQILLENTGGGKASMGNTFEDLKAIIDNLEPNVNRKVGICLDTCHAFVAGYELRTLESIETLVTEISELGLNRLKVIHANDAKFKKGSRRDQHEHIGKGHIEIEGFRSILQHPVLKTLPFILETPRTSDEDDFRNLRTMQELYRAKVKDKTK